MEIAVRPGRTSRATLNEIEPGAYYVISPDAGSSSDIELIHQDELCAADARQQFEQGARPAAIRR